MTTPFKRFALSSSFFVLTLVTPLAFSAASVDQLLNDARAYGAKGEYSSAVIQLKNALQQSPDNRDARLLLGEMYLESGDGPAAEKELATALKLGVKPGDVMPLLGKAYLIQGKFKDILAEIKLGSDAPAAKRAEVLALQGNAQLFSRAVDDAAKSYEAALALDANNATATLGKARLAFLKQDVAGGKVLVDKVVAAHPNEVDAWIMRGELLRRDNDLTGSINAFNKALTLKPRSMQALLGRATASAAAGKLDAAMVDVEQVRKFAPQYPLANYLRAAILFQRKDMAAAKDAANDVLKVIPNHAPTLFLLGAAHYGLGEFEQAEYRLGQFVGIAPGNVQARKLLAATYLKLKQPTKAIETLDVIAAQENDDAQLQALLGSAYLQAGQQEKATKYLERAAELAPDLGSIRTQLALSHMAAGQMSEATDDLKTAVGLDQSVVQADVLLVYTQLRQGKYDDAIKSAKTLIGKQPKSALAQNLLGSSLMAAGKTDDARKAFEQALKLDPAFAPAHMNLAQMALANGANDQAKAHYQDILKQDPKHMGAMLALGRLAAMGKDEKGALDWFEKARAANPKAIEPVAVVVDYHLAQGDPLKAVNAARALVDQTPDNPNAMQLLGKAQLANKEYSSAIVSFKKVADKMPQSPQPLLMVAEAQTQAKSYKDAATTLEQALNLDSKLLVVYPALVRVHLLNKDTKAAQEVVQRLRKQQPSQQALADELSGDIALSENKPKDAVAVYEKVFAKAPNRLLAMKLFSARSQAKLDKPYAPLQQWLTKNPQDVEVRMNLAIALQSAGERSAVEEYRKVIAAQPNNIVALNNLAVALQDQKDPGAVQYAEKAYQLGQGKPEIADTLGWVLVNQGQIERGLRLLQDARTNAPHIPALSYHLAAAYEKAGRREEAKKEVERLLRDQNDFPEKAQAQALFQRLTK